MSFITLDFETFYNDKVGFKSLTTEEYVNHPDFEVIGVAVQVDDGQPEWVSGTHKEIAAYLGKFDWANCLVLAHNTMFDGAILAWRFGVKPLAWLDTLSMARALHGVEVGGSLAKLAERYNIGEKGNEVVAAFNKRRADFTPEDLAKYGEYCINDTRLCYELFRRMANAIPEQELKLIDMTLKMYTHPQLYLDTDILKERLEAIGIDKQEMLQSLMERMKCESEEQVRAILSSNNQFAALLKSMDIPVPMKKSPTTGKDTFALAKKDEGFLKLVESDDEYIQQLCAVRLGTKSTLEEKRIERFIEVARRNHGALPIPLKYYAAHTGRWGGTDKINMQNLPSRDKKKKALKNAIVPPDGYSVINADSSQIEARIVAWLAGQDDVVQQFAEGKDVYSLFASRIYNKTVTKADPVERFVGKTCILGLGFGTGGAKLQDTLATAQPVNVKISLYEAKDYVNIYRDANYRIVELWADGDEMLEAMLAKRIRQPVFFGQHECVAYDNWGIILPNGLRIRYPNLRRETRDGKSVIVYDSRKGEVSIWGGTVVENVVQALARIVVGEQMLAINDLYRVALTVHDAAVVVVPDEEVESAIDKITGIMSIPPDWATGLPVTCEAKAGKSYGDC